MEHPRAGLRLFRMRSRGARGATPGGGPNGLAIGPGGALLLCNNGGFTWSDAPGLLRPPGTPAPLVPPLVEPPADPPMLPPPVVPLVLSEPVVPVPLTLPDPIVPELSPDDDPVDVDAELLLLPVLRPPCERLPRLCDEPVDVEERVEDAVRVKEPS